MNKPNTPNHGERGSLSQRHKGAQRATKNGNNNFLEELLTPRKCLQSALSLPKKLQYSVALRAPPCLCDEKNPQSPEDPTSPARYRPYPLPRIGWARRSNASLSIHPCRQAISSGHPMRRPCRFSSACTNCAASSNASGVPVSYHAAPRPSCSTVNSPRVR